MGYLDIEGDEEMDRQQYREDHPKPLRNRHTYKKVDENEMEKNIEHLYGLKMKRKEFNESKMKEAEEKKRS